MNFQRIHQRRDILRDRVSFFYFLIFSLKSVILIECDSFQNLSLMKGGEFFEKNYHHNFVFFTI
jgi:hypothetical protein